MGKWVVPRKVNENIVNNGERNIEHKSDTNHNDKDSNTERYSNDGTVIQSDKISVNIHSSRANLRKRTNYDIDIEKEVPKNVEETKVVHKKRRRANYGVVDCEKEVPKIVEQLKVKHKKPRQTKLISNLKDCSKTISSKDNKERKINDKQTRRSKATCTVTSNGNDSDNKGNIWATSLTFNLISSENDQTDSVDDYSKRLPPPAPEGEPPVESKEIKDRRIEIISKQCRLHPSNAKYNQGPVVNPPPISPGKIVGYTPGGQRYEVDLNADRPTWFNSEYARLQYDYATNINAAKMMNDLQNGYFLPDTLDINVERQYFKDKARMEKEANNYIKNICFQDKKSNTDEESIIINKTQLVETEKLLLDIVEFSMLQLNDFPQKLAKKIEDAINVDISPLMLKKHPIFVNTVDSLANQSQFLDVAESARALFHKITMLFDVPSNQSFVEYFNFEVLKLNEDCKDKTLFDVLFMSEEPKGDVGTNSSADNTDKPQDMEIKNEEMSNDEWVAVCEGENYEDTGGSNSEETLTSGANNNEE